MNRKLHRDAVTIVNAAIEAVKPDMAVKRGLSELKLGERVYLVAAGKAAWQMAKAALEVLDCVVDGVVVTKYDHVLHPLPGISCFEGGHPVPDENSFLGTKRVLEMTANLTREDTVLFLLSGGGSALFELPLIPGEELQDITKQLLAAGADIVQINTIRKRLSAVKGGRFALHCMPARVCSVILSDVLGDPPDMIASGPSAPDSSTCEQALEIADNYGLRLSKAARGLLQQETPKELHNVQNMVIGSVRELCRAAETVCRDLGYETVYLTDRLCCEARHAGSFLASIVRSHAHAGRKTAFLAGGETVVHLTGKGLGGRNQELVLSAAAELDGIPNGCVISVGSDGTDGPTDAAGGYADGYTAGKLRAMGVDISEFLKDNDSYHGLKMAEGLIFTGPTGTNVNDIAIALVDGTGPCE